MGKSSSLKIGMHNNQLDTMKPKKDGDKTKASEITYRCSCT